jgi:hypothetical protein
VRAHLRGCTTLRIQHAAQVADLPLSRLQVRVRAHLRGCTTLRIQHAAQVADLPLSRLQVRVRAHLRGCTTLRIQHAAQVADLRVAALARVHRGAVEVPQPRHARHRLQPHRRRTADPATQMVSHLGCRRGAAVNPALLEKIERFGPIQPSPKPALTEPRPVPQKASQQPWRDEKVANRNVIGREMSSRGSRRPPISLDTIIPRAHMYTPTARKFGICPSSTEHFLSPRANPRGVS